MDNNRFRSLDGIWVLALSVYLDIKARTSFYLSLWDEANNKYVLMDLLHEYDTHNLLTSNANFRQSLENKIERLKSEAMKAGGGEDAATFFSCMVLMGTFCFLVFFPLFVSFLFCVLKFNVLYRVVWE